jgi:biopolymer transport protein ExbD
MGMTTKGQAEINVTPLIDVLLVLLIIFMVMIPVMTRMHTVDIPPPLPPEATADYPVVIKVEADLTMQIDEAAPFGASDLPGQLRPMLATHKVVFLDVVDGVPWRDVIGTVDTVRGVADGLGADIQVAVRVREQP